MGQMSPIFRNVRRLGVTVAAVAVAGCVSFMEDRDADGFVRFDGRMPQEAPSDYFVLRFERPDGVFTNGWKTIRSGSQAHLLEAR